MKQIFIKSFSSQEIFSTVAFPANICCSWGRLEYISWRRLQHVFSITIFGLPRSLQDISKTSWKTKHCYPDDVFKTSWRHVSKTSSARVLKPSSRRLLKKLKTIRCCKISWNQIRHCRRGETIKAKFQITYYANLFTGIIVHIHIYIYIEKINLHLKNHSHLLEKPGNWFATAKIWEEYLKKKEILRKGPASLYKISLWNSFQFLLVQINHLVSP